VVLAGVHLPQHAAYTGLVHSEHHEQVLDHKAQSREFVDDFDMGQTLLVGTNLILALHNVNALRLKHPMSLPRAPEIEIENRFVVFLAPVFCPVVVVVNLEVLVVLVRSPARRVHVGRVGHNAVHRGIAVRQLPAVHTIPKVSRPQVVGASRNVLPKDPFAIGNVRDQAALGNEELQDVRENLVVRRLIRREDQFVRSDTTSDSAGLLGLNGCGCGDHGMRSSCLVVLHSRRCR